MDLFIGKRENWAIYNNIYDEVIFIAEALASGAFKNAKYLIGLMKENLAEFKQYKNQYYEILRDLANYKVGKWTYAYSDG